MKAAIVAVDNENDEEDLRTTTNIAAVSSRVENEHDEEDLRTLKIVFEFEKQFARADMASHFSHVVGISRSLPPRSPTPAAAAAAPPATDSSPSSAAASANDGGSDEMPPIFDFPIPAVVSFFDSLPDLEKLFDEWYSSSSLFAQTRICRRNVELPQPRKVVNSLAAFEENFLAFTNGQLDHLNWDNVVVAGGCVRCCLELCELDEQVGAKLNDLDLKFYETYHSFPSSDIDLFIYGLSASDATKKLLEIYQTLSISCTDVLNTDMVVRTTNTLTWSRGFPFRNVQVMLHTYEDIEEILHSFDLNCSAFCYNGSGVFGSVQAIRAILTGWNVLSAHCLSFSPSRMMKYEKAGFGTCLPWFLLKGVSCDSAVLLGIPKQILLHDCLGLDHSVNILRPDGRFKIRDPYRFGVGMNGKLRLPSTLLSSVDFFQSTHVPFYGLHQPEWKVYGDLNYLPPFQPDGGSSNEVLDFKLNLMAQTRHYLTVWPAFPHFLKTHQGAIPWTEDLPHQKLCLDSGFSSENLDFVRLYYSRHSFKSFSSINMCSVTKFGVQFEADFQIDMSDKSECSSYFLGKEFVADLCVCLRLSRRSTLGPECACNYAVSLERGLSDQEVQLPFVHISFQDDTSGFVVSDDNSKCYLLGDNMWSLSVGFLLENMMMLKSTTFWITFLVSIKFGANCCIHFDGMITAPNEVCFLHVLPIFDILSNLVEKLEDSLPVEIELNLLCVTFRNT